MHLIPLQCPFWLFLTPQVRPAESTGDLKDAKAVDGVLKITVRFQYTPTADVTVVVKSSNAVAVNIGNADHPNSIHTFTAKTHNDKATFAIVSTGAASTGTTATVNFITVSDDPVFHGLTDSWTYTAGTKAGTQTSCASGDVAGSVKTGTKPGSVASYATTDLAIHTTRCQGSPSRTCTAAGTWTGAPLVCTPGDTFDHSIPWTAGFGDPAARTLGVKDGDVLKFVWTGGHNVYLMKDKAAFDSCDFSGGTNLGGASPVYYTMGAATTYFACKVGSHCVSGQKLSAVIGGGTGGSSPTPAPPLTKVAGFPSTLTAGETFSFATPPANTIYTLSVKVTGRDTLLRVARSYGDASWGWEVSAECPVAIVFSAAGPSIVATLPTMSTYGSVTQYFTEAIDGKAAVDSAATKKGAVSRLLVQSTFGPTTTSMGELSSTSTNNMKSWIDAQVRGGRKETWREQGN